MAGSSASGAHPPRLLNLIGYWASCEEGQEETPGWPDPRDVMGVWDSADRQSVIRYLSSGIIFRKYLGYARCRICDAVLGSDEMTDGTWAWPEKLDHYVEVHGVQLPKDFIESARAAAWRMPASLREEFASPEMWMDAGRGVMPADPTRCGAVILKPDAWLDWAAATIPARPAPDATTFDEAKALCARLSHRQWEAFLEERFGRWRVICRGGRGESLMYVERCPAETLQRRLVAWRHPDPDALLDPEQAEAVASEFDGAWGAARIVATAPDGWLIWINPPGCDWPSSSEIQEVTKGAEFGWTTFRPDGSRSFVCPRLDELQWRMVLGRIRAETRPREQSRFRSLWRRFRSFWTG
jgi:hypothetical protein